MAALLNVKQFVRFDEHGNLHVPNKLFVACQAYVQTPLLNDNSSRVATTEWVRAQLTNITGVSFSETDPIWASDKTYYYTKLQSDARYLQSFTETDPTVSAWAKASVKPTYTFAELLSKPTTIAGYGITDIPTTLPASDVYAWAKAATKPSYAYSEITGLPTLFSGSYADLTNKPTLFSGAYTDLTGKPTLFSGAYADLTGKPTIPTNNNELTNGAGYLTSYTETDPIWTAEKTNYALKTYVDTSISDLVASAPATLNTLNELALALGSDANFATTVATNIGNRVPYTGATGNVNLGNNSLSLGTAGTAGSTISLLGTLNDYISVGTVACQVQILPASIKLIDNQAGGSLTLFLRAAGLTTGVNRTISFPNADGTVALTSDLSGYVTLATGQTISGNKTFSGTSLFTGSATFNSALQAIIGVILPMSGTVSNGSGIVGLGAYSGGLRTAFNGGYTSDLAFQMGANYVYTFPSASGTLALTSNLSAYVPYTGATTDVSLGNNTLLSMFVFIEGNGTSGGILSFKQYGTSVQSTTNHTNIFATDTDKLSFNFHEVGGGRQFTFNVSSITAGTTRTYTMPNASGTIALTSNIPSITGLVPYTGATADVDLGTRNLSSGWLFSNGNGGSNSGTINLKIGNTIQTTSGYNTIGAASGQQFVFASVVTGSYNKIAYLNLSALTDSTVRTFALPDVSGTIALTSNLSAYVPATRTITINGTAYNLSEDRAWTITTASAYTLPTASATVLGGIKVGTNLSIDANGVLSSTDTNTTYSAFTGATALANGTAGLVVAPLIANRAQYLKGDGTWGTPPDTDTTYAVFTRTAAGLAPASGGTSGTTKYLREDGTWAVPPDTDTDTNTWDANSKTVAGYVSAPGAAAHKVWKTDASGNPGWRDDADTDTNTVTQIRREDADGSTSATTYRTGDIRLRQGSNVTITEVSAGIFQIASSYVDTNTTYSAGAGLTLSGTTFSVTKTITAAQTADTIALRNGDGQLVATGFYQASSRSLKTNINPFTKSALDIIRDVTVVSFNYKTDIINKHVGFIAEDTPEELSTRHKNVMDSNNTIGVLLKAVQELEARIKQLESK
jgi:hypothetical protein